MKNSVQNMLKRLTIFDEFSHNRAFRSKLTSYWK